MDWWVWLPGWIALPFAVVALVDTIRRWARDAREQTAAWEVKRLPDLDGFTPVVITNVGNREARDVTLTVEGGAGRDPVNGEQRDLIRPRESVNYLITAFGTGNVIVRWRGQTKLRREVRLQCFVGPVANR